MKSAPVVTVEMSDEFSMLFVVVSETIQPGHLCVVNEMSTSDGYGYRCERNGDFCV